jgi:hypothetical protein
LISDFIHDFSRVPVHRPPLMLQAKLMVNPAGDDYEQEADRIADRLMRMPEPLPPRQCEGHGCCARCQSEPQAAPQESLQTSRVAPGSANQTAPPVVYDVLRAPGQPLDPATRAYMEPRFGHDLSHVRVHTDARAAESASAVGARAYTVGHNIVLGAGQYAPSSASGRRLLAHELVHALQQEGGALRLQRQCTASPCPPISISLAAIFPRYEAAERCIQTLYADTHPNSRRGISLSFNADWQHLTGGDSREKKALGCLRAEDKPGAGPDFTARGGAKGGEPDIWDFANRTMYEITTLSGSAYRIRKLGFEIDLANQLCGSADCGGLQFDRGTWTPSGCFALGADLYFSVVNDQGVIIYDIVKDTSKEVATLVALALAAALLKKFGPKAGAMLAPKAVPAYAAASALAAVVLLASGKAEAKLGPGDKEPIVMLLESLDKQGVKVPPEIQKMLDDFPELKEKINKAMGKGGDPTKAQEEFMKEMLDTIAKNKDKFTADELEALLAGTQAMGKKVPKGDVTVEALKRMAKQAKTATGEGSGGTGGKLDLPSKKETPRGTTEKDKPAPGGAQEISQAIRDRLSKSAQPVRDLLSDLMGSGPSGKRLSEAQLQRFLDLVPPGLSADKRNKLRERLKDLKDETVDQILDSLQKALEQLDKPGADKPGSGDTPGTGTPAQPPAKAPVTQTPTAPPAPGTTLTTEPTDRTPKVDPKAVIQQLANQAKKDEGEGRFKNLKAGQTFISWAIGKRSQLKGKDITPQVGDTISGTLRGRFMDKNQTPYIAHIEAEVTAVDPKNHNKIKVKYITATPAVTAKGQVVFEASHYLDNVERAMDWVPPPPPKKPARK